MSAAVLEQLALFDLLDPTVPAATTCHACPRPALFTVNAFGWYRPRRTFVLDTWAATCHEHAAETINTGRAGVTGYRGHLIRLVAIPPWTIPGGTRAYVDYERRNP